MKKAQMELHAALDPAAIYEKSKVYIQRALTAHAADDMDQYQLWASLALELLGKARLAKIHPSLIADPNDKDAKSLFAAAGVKIKEDVRTITWKTLFDRLHSLSPKFESQVKKFCDDMAQRRNAELHSGEVPFKPMKLESWESRYWQVAQLILEMMDLTLEEWLGAGQAKAPKSLVKHAQEATVKAAKVRLEDAKARFASKDKEERQKIKKQQELVEGKEPFHFRELFPLGFDGEWTVSCPACGSNAFMAGTQHGEEFVDNYEEYENPFEEDVEKYYFGEQFRCLVCELQLNSAAELEALGLDVEHTEIETRDRVFEPDYGND